MIPRFFAKKQIPAQNTPKPTTKIFPNFGYLEIHRFLPVQKRYFQYLPRKNTCVYDLCKNHILSLKKEVLRHSCLILGDVGALFGRSLGALGAVWGLLGASWANLELSGIPLGSLWGHIGGHLGSFLANPGSSWDHFWPIWETLEHFS